MSSSELGLPACREGVEHAVAETRASGRAVGQDLLQSPRARSFRCSSPPDLAERNNLPFRRSRDLRSSTWAPQVSSAHHRPATIRQCRSASLDERTILIVSDSTTVPATLVPGLVSRIKIMAEMNTTERRIPQDGRMGLTIDGRFVDIQVSTLPIIRGESGVLRILGDPRHRRPAPERPSPPGCDP